MGTYQGKSLPKNFIDMSEINENFDEETVPTEGATEDAPVDNAPVTDEATEGAEGTEGSEEGQPEVIKVYTDSEEDVQELVDAGILEEDGTLPEDGLYIKIKTVEGEEVTLLFTEKDPSARTPVTDDENADSEDSEGSDASDVPAEDDDSAPVTEGEEFDGEDDVNADAGSEEGTEGTEDGTDTTAPGRYDTELCAQHNDHEYCVSAEIEISDNGEVQDVDIENDDETGEPEVHTEDVDDDSDSDDLSAGLPEDNDDEDAVTESKIWDFNTFLRNRK